MHRGLACSWECRSGDPLAFMDVHCDTLLLLDYQILSVLVEMKLCRNMPGLERL